MRFVFAIAASLFDIGIITRVTADIIKVSPSVTASENAAEELADHARKLSKSGDKKLGRGYLSLALHLDPFLADEQAYAWVGKALKNEPLEYWRGNAFVGHDKTLIESFFSRSDIFQDKKKLGIALYTWRGLELTGLSCCGVDNMAVFFSQSNRHLYVAPFVHLVPGYENYLKPDNQKMYESFNNWWESIGRRPMPEPAPIHHGDGRFEWDRMKVVLRASRVPAGWNDVIQAVLMYRLGKIEDARVCVRGALRANMELETEVFQLMPRLKSLPDPLVPAVLPLAVDEKYVVCYNPHVGLGNLAVVMTSAHLLAKLTGRKFLLHWNVNLEVRHSFKLREQPGVSLLGPAVDEVGVAPQNVKNLYFFHMMHSPDLGEMLETLACSDMRKKFEDHRYVTMSSNMFFAPLLTVNPHVPAGTRADFPEMLEDLLQPSDESVSRALDYVKKSKFGSVPVIAIHIRAREENEDNDDWPTASSPSLHMLETLRSYTERAVARELNATGGWFGFGQAEPQWDLFVASTTEKARRAAVNALAGAKGLRRTLQLPALLRDRKSHQGSVDAMAEALLISRASVFMRLVVGTSGFSTFAFLSNALRRQNEWTKGHPELERDSGYAPNYLVTEDCGSGRCFEAPPDVRMAHISWHGERFVQRSCGDVLGKVADKGFRTLGCAGLKSIDDGGGEEL